MMDDDNGWWMMMMEDDGRWCKKKVEKCEEKTLFLKVAGDHLGTFGGVPIAPKKLYPTEVTTFFSKVW